MHLLNFRGSERETRINIAMSFTDNSLLLILKKQTCQNMNVININIIIIIKLPFSKMMAIYSDSGRGRSRVQLFPLPFSKGER